MFDLTTLDVPIIAAPMAGGPTTPALVIAAARAGGLGFLAAGYKSPSALGDEVVTVARTRVAFGVNIFVPGPPLRDRTATQSYRAALSHSADHYGITLPDNVENDDDAFDAKIDVVIEHRVPLVSFTFGLPSANVAQRLHRAGVTVIATITDPNDVSPATDIGVDALCVQGVEAGGHRATFDGRATPNAMSTVELVRRCRTLTGLPLIAAGGIADGHTVADCLAAGATAVQIGTALLDSDEAGTNPVHRAALHNSDFLETTVTRAFSGRPARALRNRFIDTYDALVPAEYPAVHHLTSPLRKAAIAAGDAHGVHLWAGTAHGHIESGSVGEILTRLWSAAQGSQGPPRTDA